MPPPDATSCTAFVVAARSVTSTRPPVARPPPEQIRSTVSDVSSTSHATTSAPAPASATADSAPIPRAAPVTTARLPSSDAAPLTAVLPGIRSPSRRGGRVRRDLVEQRRHPERARVDAEHRRQLQHLHDLLGRRAIPERVADVLAEPRLVEVRRGGVDRHVDQLLDLRRERSRLPRHRGEPQVRLEEVGVELEQALPHLAPVPAGLDEPVAEIPPPLILGHALHLLRAEPDLRQARASSSPPPAVDGEHRDVTVAALHRHTRRYELPACARRSSAVAASSSRRPSGSS